MTEETELPAVPVPQLRRREPLAVVFDDDRYFLAAVPYGHPIVITGAGALIWEATDRPRTPDEIVAVVAELAEQPVDLIAEDVVDTLHRLVAHGLLVALS